MLFSTAKIVCGDISYVHLLHNDVPSGYVHITYISRLSIGLYYTNAIYTVMVSGIGIRKGGVRKPVNSMVFVK